MSNEQRLRTTQGPRQPVPADGPTTELDSDRAEVDRVLAAANLAFDRMRATNSEDFLSRSRQTGGQ
jgi:hypothetical protein